MKLWLRHETKDNEQRTILTPEQVKILKQSNIVVNVEKSETRIFKDKEYQEAGAQLVEAQSWKDAPLDFYILGLKELPTDDFDLCHRHILFAHVFKEQDGYKQTLNRFKSGGGKLFDLEYLVDSNNKRIAAFGKWAGFVGTALSIDAFLYKKIHNTPYPKLHSFDTSTKLINQIQDKLKQLIFKPKIMIIGHKGKCGSGAVQVIKKLGLEATLWDAKKTAPGGPFKEILEHHIFINTALILKKIKPFIDESILFEGQNLSMISDIGCDPTSDLNPVPLYSNISSFDKPFIQYNRNGVTMDILAIDNLPTILPRESSMDFSKDFFPHLLDLLKDSDQSPVWNRAFQVFQSALDKLT